MGTYTEIKGDLIKLTKEGYFDVISHGVNCWNMVGAGIALPMRLNFSCDKFDLEQPQYRGDINKLGQIDYELVDYSNGQIINDWDSLTALHSGVVVVNAYTQYEGGANLDYEALTLCLKKMNHTFKGRHIGLSMIGCGIAGGSWSIVKKLIQGYLADCKVTEVIYE